MLAEEIFAEIGRDRHVAAGKTLAHLQGSGGADDFMSTARRLILLKGRDPHDYKFSVAALEDYYHVSPEWRDRFLAASVMQLRGSQEKDNSLIDRIRAAVQAIAAAISPRNGLGHCRRRIRRQCPRCSIESSLCS